MYAAVNYRKCAVQQTTWLVLTCLLYVGLPTAVYIRYDK